MPVDGDATYTATYRESTRKTWMDIDLRTGAVGYYDLDFAAATNKFNTEEYKTVKMAFRRVERGDDYFVQNGTYTANFTNSYYIGMFEVTAAQYALMQNPSAYVSKDVSFLRSQGYCNRSGVRGMADAPTAFGEGITAASPLGRLNALVQAANEDARLVFDLPTEAMWEVAARAVESGDDSRKDWKYFFGNDDSELPQYAFYENRPDADAYGITSAMRVPGCKLPNAWGLYDMYGNARDVCLDVHTGATDNWSLAPYYGGNWQRDRGGAYNDGVGSCNSASRSYHDSGGYDHSGIRLAMICSDDDEIVRTMHTVRWQNWDGKLLQEDEVVDGGYVRYRGATPTRPRIDMKTYVFRGWTPVVSPLVTADAVYTAAYDERNVLLPDDYKTEGWTFDETELTLRSKAIGHGGWTEVHLNVTGPGSLLFQWIVSSEGNYDWLRFYRGDTQIAAISGGPNWATISNRVDTAGTVVFKWAYSKDGSASSGSDCGWIKDIVWIPDAAGTQVFVGGESVEFERSVDGKTFTATVPAGTFASEVPVKVDGIDVSKGFRRKVEGMVFTAELVPPFEVEKSPEVPDEPFTETDNGDGTVSVTLNVEVVPGLYYATAAATSLDALVRPAAVAPANAGTRLTLEKPSAAGSAGSCFYKVWVSDAPIAAEP